MRFKKFYQLLNEDASNEYEVPGTNLLVVGFGRDVNGNATIKVTTPNQRVRALQTGDVFEGKTVRDSYWKDGDAADVAKINAALVSYVERFVKSLPLKKFNDATDNMNEADQKGSDSEIYAYFKKLFNDAIKDNLNRTLAYENAFTSTVLMYNIRDAKMKEIIKANNFNIQECNDTTITEDESGTEVQVGDYKYTVQIIDGTHFKFKGEYSPGWSMALHFNQASDEMMAALKEAGLVRGDGNFFVTKD